MEITKALCLSTSHISKATADALEADTLHLTAWKAGYGWFIPAYVDTDLELMKWPADLMACRTMALEAGCEFIRLDCDGPTEEGLETYDW